MFVHTCALEAFLNLTLSIICYKWQFFPSGMRLGTYISLPDGSFRSLSLPSTRCIITEWEWTGPLTGMELMYYARPNVCALWTRTWVLPSLVSICIRPVSYTHLPSFLKESLNTILLQNGAQIKFHQYMWIGVCNNIVFWSPTDTGTDRL